MPRHVLVMDEDGNTVKQIEVPLCMLSCTVKHVTSSRRGLEEALSGAYDLIILNLDHPAPGWMETCRTLRASDHYMPIIMLSPSSGEVDRILALEIGADHYVTKPFSVLELVAHVKAIFRILDKLLPRHGDARPTIQCKNLTINEEKHEVAVGARSVELTAKEFQLLLYLARHAGKVYSRSQLLDQIWGYHHSGYEHTVNSHINRLRAKIEENPDDPQFIQTVWGVGYKFREQAQERDLRLARAA